MTDSKKTLSARPFALVAVLTFLPVIVSFAIEPADTTWVEYLGLVFHLSIFFLVSILPAPDWGKAAGYGWILLDVLAGVLMINNVPPETGDFVRLTGHIFAGLWLIGTSLNAAKSMKILGIITGLWLGGYTFVAPFLPMTVVGPASLLMTAWLVLIAKENRSK